MKFRNFHIFSFLFQELPSAKEAVPLLKFYRTSRSKITFAFKMGNRQIKIDQGRVVPMLPRLLGTGLIITTIIYLMDQAQNPNFTFTIAIVVGSTLVHVLWSTRRIFAFDQHTGTFSHYYWLLGFKAQNRTQHGKGTAVILRKMGRDQKVPGNYPWKVYIKLAEDNEVFVISRENSEDGMTVASSIAKKLGLKVRKE